MQLSNARPAQASKRESAFLPATGFEPCAYSKFHPHKNRRSLDKRDRPDATSQVERRAAMITMGGSQSADIAPLLRMKSRFQSAPTDRRLR